MSAQRTQISDNLRDVRYYFQNRYTIASTRAQGESNFRVLRALDMKPTLNQRELAAELGVTLGSFKCAVEVPVKGGFVKADNFRK